MAEKNLFSLNGKTAVVTGGTGLIGSAIVHAYLDAGATVINVDLKASSNKAIHENIDLGDIENLEAHVKKLFEKYPSIHIWVNNAYARTEDWGKKNLSVKSWRENVDLQLNSYCILSQTVVEIWKRKSLRGSLINLGSIYGVVSNDPGIYEGTDLSSLPAYAAIKGGVVQFSRYLAGQYGAHGIRVNSLCPGGIEDHQDKRFIENYSRRVPMKRMGKPEEVAGAAVFLASDAASYVTGTTLMVDGGWTAI